MQSRRWKITQVSAIFSRSVAQKARKLRLYGTGMLGNRKLVGVRRSRLPKRPVTSTFAIRRVDRAVDYWARIEPSDNARSILILRAECGQLQCQATAGPLEKSGRRGGERVCVDARALHHFTNGAR